MGKKGCLVLEMSSVLRDNQSLEIQVEGLLSGGEDQTYIKKFKSMILQFLQEEVIHDIHHERELNQKSEVFNETWLFGCIPLSKAMELVRSQKFGIKGESLQLSLLEFGKCRLLNHHGIYFSQPVNGFA